MLAWQSGSRARRPVLRLLPIIILAFAISSVFGIASIFSSNVTSETLNQVLLKGKRCGSFSKAKANSVYKELTLLLPYQAEKANKFLNYGMQCYTNNSHTDGCNTYLKPRLPLISTRGHPCPFGDNICKLENDNLMMDTGYLDSLEDLGINTAPHDRFQLRMVYQCAPLKTQGYTRDYNDSDYGAVKRYMYGSVVNVKQTINWTYEVPVDNAYLPGDGTSSANIPRVEYQLGIEKHYGTPNETLLSGTNEWSPIPALRLVDSDVHLAFLSAPEIHFSTPVNDPWFSAHKNASEINNQATKEKFVAYLQDEPLGVMACTQQVQYCNPNLPKDSRCEPLRGVIDPRKSARVKAIFPSESQFATIKWVDNLWTYGVYTISATLGFIGASALRARYSLSYGYSGPLPDNQWQLEAEHWLKGTLASLQDVFIEAANGMPAALEDFRKPPMANETVARNMCVNQKVVSNSYSSFNVLGLSLILGIGVLIIVLDMGLEPSVAWWQRRNFRSRQHAEPEFGMDDNSAHPLYAAIEWSQTNILQLQRLAHEEAGYGEWSRCDKDVPVTESGQLIAGLDLRNTTHPLLKQKRETPASDWDHVAPFKPWGIRRSDTGLETLVDNQVEGEKKEKEDVDEMPPVFHAIGETEEERRYGLGVQMAEGPMHEDRVDGWRTLR
jgi:hypothetical protein